MKVLVFIGFEFSGKSWFVEQFQVCFGGWVVGEYVCYFIDEQCCDICYVDIFVIVCG